MSESPSGRPAASHFWYARARISSCVGVRTGNSVGIVAAGVRAFGIGRGGVAFVTLEAMIPSFQGNVIAKLSPALVIIRFAWERAKTKRRIVRESSLTAKSI